MQLKKNKNINVTYLYKKGRKKRLENQIASPSEFFYGYKVFENLLSFLILYLDGLNYELNLKKISLIRLTSK